MKHMIVLALALLAGCASPPYWVKTHEPLTPLPVVVVSASPWGPGVLGWVTRNKQEGTCQVYVVAGADRECVTAHELRHCAGHDHPHYKQAFIC